jgi:hypothetical protein
MNLYLTTVKKRQIARWNRFCSILSNLLATFRAYKHTVITSFASDFYWVVGDIKPRRLCFVGSGMFPTSGTRGTQTLPVILPTVGDLHSSATKLKLRQHNLPPSEYIWKEYCGGVFELSKNGKDTGIVIYIIDRLIISYYGVGNPPSEYKDIRLKQPMFHIEFWPNGDYDKRFHLVDIPTLKQAKELAELFYSKWLKANSPSKGSLS